MRNRNYCAFQNTRILKFKSQLTLLFLLPSVILAELIGNRSLLKWAQEVIVHDWWISIPFVCFCVPGFISCARNCDWRQRKTQLWRRLLNFRVRVFLKSAVKFSKKLLHYDKVTVSCPTNMSADLFFQALHQTLQTTKINLKKTVSLNSFFYKSQLQSASIFFKFVHPCLILFYIPSVVPSLYVLSSGYVYVPLSLVSVPPAILNPLNYNIKIEILIYCPYTFLIRVVGTICRNINETLFPDNVLNSHDHSVF